MHLDILQRKAATCHQLKLSNYSSVAVISSWPYCSVALSLSEGTNINYCANYLVDSVFQGGLYLENIVEFQCTPLYKLFRDSVLTISDANLWP